MSLLGQQNFLNEMIEQLNIIIPKNQCDKIVEITKEILCSYNIELIDSNNDIFEKDTEIIELFLGSKEVSGRALSTIKHYRRILNKLIKDLNIPIKKITVSHLRTWLMKEKNRGVSLPTLDNNRYVLTSFFNWCWREEIIEKNPVLNLTPIKKPKIIKKPFTASEIEKIKQCAKTDRDIAIITFLLSTGCRVGEVYELNKEDINFQLRQVKVFGKGSKERIVYLDDIAIMYLKKYLNSRKDDNPCLFIGKMKERLTPSGIRNMLKEISKSSGIQNVHPHRFRRTLATNLINHGMPIQEVATILGHDKIETTMEYVYIDQHNVENSYRKYI